jgi:hypothetical protein
MPTGYRVKAALTSLALIFAVAATPRGPRAHAPQHHRPAAVRPAASPEDIYSARARRRLRLLLQYRYYELRRARLDRLERMLEQKLGLPPAGAQARKRARRAGFASNPSSVPHRP